MFYIKQELPTNGQIRAKEVQLISENGEKLGIVPLARALELSTELIKPVDLYYIWHSKTLGTKLAKVTLRAVPILVICSMPSIAVY